MKAIIIGAGIGGLTTAIALAQKGISYEIYDATPVNKPVGAGILLGANAMNVFEKLGVAAALRNRSVNLDNIYIKDYRGEILQHIDNNRIRARFGSGMQAIHRAALQQELINKLAQPVQWGRKLIAVQQTADTITAQFEDGTTATGDLLIGVDGIRSVVREKYIAPASYRYSDQTCWRAVIPMTLPHNEQQETAEVWGNGNGLRASFTQVGPEQVYFWFTKKMPAGTHLEPAAALALIRNELTPFKGYMQTVLQQLTADTLIHGDLYDIAPISSFYKGRIVLLGDAAHATTPNLGQGASQAIEDAYVLAACLYAAPTLADAFRNYQQRRMARVHKIVKISWQLSQLTNMKGRLATWFRNTLVKNIPGRVADKQLAFLYGVEL